MGGNSFSYEELIPFSKSRMPSRDLVFMGKVLTPEKAWRLQHHSDNPLDLSKLDPEDSVIWKNEKLSRLETEIDDIDINSESDYSFEGTILSNQGILRFNVLPKNNPSALFTM